jgi:hypothetical protein
MLFIDGTLPCVVGRNRMILRLILPTAFSYDRCDSAAF